MRSVALLPSIAILAGVCAGVSWADAVALAVPLLVCAWVVAAVAWSRHASGVAVCALTTGYALAGMALGASAAGAALAPSLLTVLGEVGPVTLRVRLIEDAAPRDFGASMRAEAEAVEVRGRVRRVSGGLRLAVSGAAAAQRIGGWRAGRVVEAPAVLRRPARYLNDGVPDFEREMALDGVAVMASVKSGLLVRIVARGSAFEEAAAELRAHVRTVVARHVGVRDPVSGAIVTAILIGDRTALPDDVRDRLQAAGTYHVIAISGGNIAILAALMAGVLMGAGARGRSSAAVIIAGLAAYACVVSAGPSVWRATVTAIAYLAARLVDHRSPPWNAMAVSAAVLACASPLDVRDAGFTLTFGATAAILEAARRVPGSPRRALTWVMASVVASFATEIVLLPINAITFSRVTAAGLGLNLLSVPLMTMTQIAGLVLVCASSIAWAADAAAAVATAGARGLVDSARLVEVWPWLAMRVPPPAAVVVAVYYVALAAALWVRRARPVAFVFLVGSGVAILGGATAAFRRDDLAGRLRLTMFDVGQGEAMLLQTPGGRALMVDAGGAGFDGGAFDIGGRVLAPALWARGVTRLDALAITHGDPDHIGGAIALVRDFTPSEIWEGIPMPGHALSRALVNAARSSGAGVRQRLAGWVGSHDGVRIRVLSPPAPDWERPHVRNDDSIVLEVRFGSVAIVLAGDIGAEVERTLLPVLSDAPIRILKVAHHGSRTSTSQALLDAWKPQVALISCGRGNRFGHPAPEVTGRLEAAGVRIYRTDRDGQITVDTDGRRFSIRTHSGGTQ